ncbi:MAG: tetratricopeptide repeat protein, partial [Planctomycetota bacterium]
VTAKEAARNMAEALGELDRIRLQVRSGVDLPGAADALARLRASQPGLYPAAFEQQRVLDAIGRPGEATAVLEQLRDDTAATGSFRAAAAIMLGMRALEMTELSHPDSVDDLINALPAFTAATTLAEPGSPYHVAARALMAVAVAARAPDRRAIQEAIDAADSAVKVCPTMWEPWYALARARALPATPVRRTDGVGNVDPASVIDACDHVLKVEPASYAAWRLRARYTLAWRDITLLRQYEQSPASLLIEAHARRLDGDPTPTIHIVEELAATAQGDNDNDTAGWTFLELAECAREAGEFQRAMTAIREAIERLPQALAPRRVRARIVFELSQSPAQRVSAVADLDYVISRDPQHLPALGLRAMLRAAMQDLAMAEEDLSSYIGVLPTAAAHDARARVRLALGNAEGAFQDWSVAVQKEPNRFLAWTSYYRSLYYCYRFKDALQAFQGAWRCAPEGLRTNLELERQRIEQYAHQEEVYAYAMKQNRDRMTPQYVANVGVRQLEVEGFGAGLPRELSMTMIELVREHSDRGSMGHVVAGTASLNSWGASPPPAAAAPGVQPGEVVGLDASHARPADSMERQDRNGSLAGPRRQFAGRANADDVQADGEELEKVLREKAEALAQEIDEREKKRGERVNQQWMQNQVSDELQLSASLPLQGLDVLLGRAAADKEAATDQEARAQELLDSPVGEFTMRAGKDTVIAIRGVALLMRADARVQQGDLAGATDDFDAAARHKPLNAEESFYAAAAWMALANQAQRPAGTPGVELCRDRVLGYLEAAVYKGLDVARLKEALFRGVAQEPKFKQLLAKGR